MFGKDERIDRLSAAIESQSKNLAEIVGKLKANSEVLGIADEYAQAKKNLTDLQIELDRVKETHAREKREIEHMVGLEKKRQEFEIEAAKRDAVLSVREENLEAERERFQRDVDFIKAQTKEQRDMTKAILERLPDVSVMLGAGSKDA